jgi:hypothetical protein
MCRLPVLRTTLALLLGVSLSLAASLALAQWYPSQPQQPQVPQVPQGPQLPQVPQVPQAPQYPPQFPQPSQYPPQAPQYPGAPSAPGPSIPGMAQPPMPGGVPPGGQMFADAFGRFRVSLPQGTMPVGAIYNFMNPAAMTQISIQSMGQEQMFQMNLQNFPAMMRQMGATVDTEQPLNVRGKQARLIAATMRDQTSGTSMHSMNVFISEVNLWIQVMGPEQNAPQLQQTLQAILNGLQF